MRRRGPNVCRVDRRNPRPTLPAGGITSHSRRISNGFPRTLLIGVSSLALVRHRLRPHRGVHVRRAGAAQGVQLQAADAQAAAAVPKVTRAQVITRAKTWHPHTSSRVPYSQSKTHGGYRTDCSGYASMTLRLPKPGPNTVGLASSTYSTRIKMSQLRRAT